MTGSMRGIDLVLRCNTKEAADKGAFAFAGSLLSNFYRASRSNLVGTSRFFPESAA
jgi:hypothetical protein